MLSHDLKLPNEKRSLFKGYLGTFIEEKEPGYPEKAVIKRIEEYSPLFVSTIGDVCTETLIAAGSIPNIAITDDMTTRQARTPLIIDGAIELHANNPQGMITQDAWSTIRDAINQYTISDSTPIHIHIRGEEDLLTLPMVLEAPSSAMVIYGQPNVEGRSKRGLVYVEVTEEVKRRVRGYIDLMVKPTP